MEYKKEDFENSTAPFEEVYKNHNDPFQEKRMLEKMCEVAKDAGVTGFRKLYQAYCQSLKKAADSTGGEENIAQFDEQALELSTGEWHADDHGVWKYGAFGALEIACTHPIMPVERLKNIDTGELKIRLAFRRGNSNKRTWNEILADFDTVSNAKNIVALSRIGISVTSGKRAQNLVDYIADVIDENYDRIPERKSVSRMGWNDDGFSPYVKDTVFDGNVGYAGLFKSIREHGQLDVWRNEAIAARKFSIAARIVIASSFASALIEPLGTLPFFVHLWGMDSGTGKSVCQMVAAAVWGDPFIGGEYFKTFRTTTVASELAAGFLNSIPLFMDELQLSKDTNGGSKFNVYELSSGAGKGRATKTLGLATTVRWRNCFITSGETPLVKESDGAGAVNRVIEIECRANSKVIENGHGTANTVRENFGHSGKIFVEKLCEPGAKEEAKQLYEKYSKACMENDTTDKQAMAAAIVLTADELATRWIFNDGNFLTVADFADFLKSRETVSAADRGYDFICDWVSQNASRLCGSAEAGDVYGKIPSAADEDAGWVYIIRSVFNRVCGEAGISAPALLSHLKTRELIQTRGKGMTKTKRINGVPTECVIMKLPVETKECPF